MSTVGLGFRYFSTIAPHFGQVNSVFIISPLSKMKGMFPICIEGNPPIHRPQTVLLPKSRPKAQQGIFKPCPVIQSFQRKTNSAHLSRREARNHPPPHNKSLGRGREGVWGREGEAACPLYGGSSERFSLPSPISFPYFQSPKSSRHSKPSSR